MCAEDFGATCLLSMYIDEPKAGLSVYGLTDGCVGSENMIREGWCCNWFGRVCESADGRVRRVSKLGSTEMVHQDWLGASLRKQRTMCR